MDFSVDQPLPLNGLLIGTASAATQIEGGDRNNSWWQWAQTPGNVADGSSPERANDHWNRWRDDNALMASLRYPIARIGLEWSRIEPEPGQYSTRALDRYREEIGDLLEKGIRPLVTLHHFSNPLWLQRAGEWTNPATVNAFVKYVRVAVRALQDLVCEWVTINEPNVYATQAYLFREGPPGRVSPRELRSVLRHMAVGHLFAYQAIRDLQPEATVTIAHHLREFAPKDPHNAAHRAFTRFDQWAFQDALTLAFGQGRFPGLLGRSPVPAGSYVDVIGLNYYSRTAVSGIADGTFDDVPLSDLGWEIYPEGLVNSARTLYEQLGVPVWITENGTADNGDGDHMESFRPRFIAEHLAAILRSDVPIERYYHWCFVDNWEWSDGEVPRFGLIHNDYETQTRTVKPSARMLSEIVAEGALTPAIVATYASGQEYRKCASAVASTGA